MKYSKETNQTQAQKSKILSKEQFVWVPEKVYSQIREILPESMWADEFYFLYLISLARDTRRGRNQNGYVNLSWVILKNFIPVKKLKILINLATQQGILVCDGVWAKATEKKHGKCLGYKLGPNYQNDKIVKVLVIHSRLAGKLARHGKQKNGRYKYLDKVILHHEQQLKLIQIDEKEAREIIATLPIGDKQNQANECLNNFLSGNFYASVDMKGGRFHSVCTNLPKCLRSILKINDKYLTEIDICNCQPLIISISYLLHQIGKIKEYQKVNFSLLNNDYNVSNVFSKKERKKEEEVSTPLSVANDTQVLTDKEFEKTSFLGNSKSLFWEYVTETLTGYDFKVKKALELPEDVKSYIEVTKNGTLYETLAAIAGMTRDQVKKQMWPMLYGRQELANRIPLAKTFQKLYPSIWGFIKKAKAKDYKTFAWYNQQLEADFVLHHVVKRVMLEKPDMPVITIYDSWLCETDNAAYLERVIHEEMQEFGLDVKLKIKFPKGK